MPKKIQKQEQQDGVEAEFCLADGVVQDSYIVLHRQRPSLRMVLDYPLNDPMADKYADTLRKFNTRGPGECAVVPAPLHFDGTYMFMCLDVDNAKSWTLVRGYKTLRFNTEFVLDPQANAFVPRFLLRNNNVSPILVPDATLQAPEGYRFIVTLNALHGLFLFGVCDSDSTVFRVPTPNMSFDTGHLCEGYTLSEERNQAVQKAMQNTKAFTDILQKWEAAQWNSDLTGSLPTSEARQFLRWNAEGKHLPDAKVWDELARAFPLEGGGTNQINRQVIRTYMLDTDHVCCDS